MGLLGRENEASLPQCPGGLLLVEQFIPKTPSSKEYGNELYIRIRCPDRDICRTEFGIVIDTINFFLRSFKRLDWDAFATKIINEENLSESKKIQIRFILL